jgi:trimethylamine--corrinoid protein Co-methyltransferase
MVLSNSGHSTICISEETLDRFHLLALEVLEKTGVCAPETQTLTAMEEAGFKISYGDQRVRYPPQLTEEYLAHIPKRYAIAGREPKDDLELSVDSLLVRPQSGCPNVLEFETNRCRPACIADVVAMAKLTEMLPNIHIAGALLYPQDVPVENRDVAILAAMFKTTRKHAYIQPYGLYGAERMLEMAEVWRGGSQEATQRPPVTFITGPTSPLTIAPNELAILRLASQKRMPLMFGSTPICGATGPITLAGQIVLHHAENLAGLVLVQVYEPGAPVSYAIRPSSMDLRTANSVWGAAEWGITTAVMLQLARRNGLITDAVGLPTDSKALDEQAGVEKGFNAALAALFGANVVAGAGFIETIMTGSLEQLVIDDDISGMMLRARRGIEIDDEHLACQLIQNVGPGGNYLTNRHTLRYMRSEMFIPAILNRQNRDGWARSGAKDVVQVAGQRAKDLIAAYNLPPLNEDVVRELDRIAYRVPSD